MYNRAANVSVVVVCYFGNGSCSFYAVEIIQTYYMCFTAGDVFSNSDSSKKIHLVDQWIGKYYRRMMKNQSTKQ